MQKHITCKGKWLLLPIVICSKICRRTGVPPFGRSAGSFFITDEGLTVRNHTSYIVKFDYVDTLAQAGRLVGCEVLFEKRMLEGQEPEESGYDIFELIGFEVKDQVSEETGEVADVADYSGNVVLTVSIMNKEILLPLSENYICEIDFEHSRLLVQIPRELVELN